MTSITALAILACQACAFVPSQKVSRQGLLFASSSMTPTAEQVKSDMDRLKKVLEREYVSFFSPMETEYYTKDVTFKDPLNDLAGVEAYENNVNM